MKQLITAVVLATAVVTAQAKEVVLECSVSQDSKKVVMMVDAEATLMAAKNRKFSDPAQAQKGGNRPQPE